ncbi:MAG: hypothetical protein MZU95_01905 [Desulfomicrobium escambiense]|nr:hypothetical protein [Desulfomicrobium escambiense]
MPLNAFGIFGAERYPENAAGRRRRARLPRRRGPELPGRPVLRQAARLRPRRGDTGGVLREAGTKVARAIGPGRGLPRARPGFPGGRPGRPEREVHQAELHGLRVPRATAMSLTYRSGGQELEGFFVDAGGAAAGRGGPGPAPRGPDRRQAGR